MSTAYFYAPSTGIFTAMSYAGADVVGHTPAGLAAYQGTVDWLSQRVDLSLLAAKTKAIADAQAALDAAKDPVAIATATAQMADALALNVLTDYTPPAPAPDEDNTVAWSAATKRWQKTHTLTYNKKLRKAPVQAQIDALVATQHDPARNLLIALGNSKAGASPLAKLQAIDDAITPLQAKLAAITACATQEQLDAIPE